MTNVLNLPGIKGDSPNIDVPHLLLSAITVAGVDTVLAFDVPKATNTRLIHEIFSDIHKAKWIYTSRLVDEVMKNYNPELTKNDYSLLSDQLTNLLFAVENNSSIIQLVGDFLPENEKISPELNYPLRMLSQSIDSATAKLPVVKMEVKGDEVRRLFDSLKSREFQNLQEAHQEIELKLRLTEKIIKSIELAAKDFYRKNLKVLGIKENLIISIPLTNKVVEDFFGKLPGILSEFATNFLTNYMKNNQSIAIYNCSEIYRSLLNKRFEKLFNPQQTIKSLGPFQRSF